MPQIAVQDLSKTYRVAERQWNIPRPSQPPATTSGMTSTIVLGRAGPRNLRCST
jgi:hypothetical protein